MQDYFYTVVLEDFFHHLALNVVIHGSWRQITQTVK